MTFPSSEMKVPPAVLRVVPMTCWKPVPGVAGGCAGVPAVMSFDVSAGGWGAGGLGAGGLAGCCTGAGGFAGAGAGGLAGCCTGGFAGAGVGGLAGAGVGGLAGC